jgi:hypothetical protein
MYTNIPTTEVKELIANILNRNPHFDKERKEELINLVNIVLEQNYLEYNNQFSKSNEGLPMGAPTSAILAETFIQYLEHTTIWKVLQHRILDYYRYVDDILIVYNSDTNWRPAGRIQPPPSHRFGSIGESFNICLILLVQRKI